MTSGHDQSFRPGDRVDYLLDPRTSLPATVLEPFDDGYLIRLDPAGLTSETLARVLGEVNAHFVEHDEALLDYQDALFVSGERLRHHG